MIEDVRKVIFEYERKIEIELSSFFYNKY